MPSRAERSSWEFERSFLNGRSFRDLGDMRIQLVGWLDRIVDQRRRRQSAPITDILPARVTQRELFIYADLS